MAPFKSKLTDVEKTILQMHYDGNSLKELTTEVGFIPSVQSVNTSKRLPELMKISCRRDIVF